jgi:ubiquinone/menaquinone biosynthesis C-methylase UbiE
MEETIQTQPTECYQEYYARKGKDRNDILANRGVLFQTLALQKSVVEAISALPISRNWKVLDVGCGSGGSLLQFLGFGFAPGSLYGIDSNPGRIQEGKERYPNLNFTCGDASRMGYNSDYFDIVMESTMFMTLPDDTLSQKIAEEMVRVVKPSGYIMLIDWRYSHSEQHEYKALSRKRINHLFKVGTKTTIHCFRRGALLPPFGRFLSTYFQSFYFVIQRLLPFCVAQVVTVLQKAA